MEQTRYYYSIASGSSGNCGLYVAGQTAILIDLGISLRRITHALREVGLTPDRLAGVLITHAHIDHIKGLEMFVKKYDTPLFATEQTALALQIKMPAVAEQLQVFTPGERFGIRGVAVDSFWTPHDAEGSVGYILEQDTHRFGFATDLGFVPQQVRQKLYGCEAVVLESNHDVHMLQAGPYPYSLKMRVAGQYGHLSNPDCAVFATELVKNGTRTIVLAHLSEKNNMPELALQETKNALAGLPPCTVVIAPKDCMAAPIPLEGGTQCSLFD